jgi:hypothetical protein
VAIALAVVPACSEASKVAARDASAVTTSAKKKITINPATGRPRTHFKVTFTAPQGTTASISGSLRQYELSASTRAHTGCVSTGFESVGARRGGQRVSVKLIPQGSGAWCTGTFHGKIIETFRPVCGPAKACPQFIGVIRTIGGFTLRVKAAGGSSSAGAGTGTIPTPAQPVPCVPVKSSAPATCG